MTDVQARSGFGVKIAFIVLIVFFLGMSISLGGAVYSSRVVEDLWSSSPPDSLRYWSPAMLAAGANFWRIGTPLTALFALLTFATAFSTPRRERGWRMVSAVLFVAAAISSIVYFAPTVGRLAPPDLDQLSAAEATAIVRRWTRLDALRMAAVALAWASGLRALLLRGHDRGEDRQG